jgi:type IV secretory pathway TraG/TraD family ATPase VirD4
MGKILDCAVNLGGAISLHEAAFKKWLFISVAGILALGLVIVVWVIYRRFASFSSSGDEQVKPWATKKEIKKHLRIISQWGAEFNIIKLSFWVSALFTLPLYLLLNLQYKWLAVYLISFMGALYFGFGLFIEKISKIEIPDYPEKRSHKFYSALLKRFTPGRDFYYLGKYKGMHIGIPRLGRFVHMLIVGPTDSEKSSSFIEPQMLMDATSRGSAIAPDVKSPGTYNLVAGRWIAAGKKALLFDPWDDRCIGFEPLWGANDETLWDIVEVFTQEKEDVLKEQGFFKGKTEYFLFNLFKLAQALDREHCNLATVFQMVESVGTLAQFIQTAHNDELWRHFSGFLKMSNSDKENTLTSIRKKLIIFLDPKVCAAFSRSDFNLEILFREGEPCLLVVGAPISKKDFGQKIASLISNLVIKAAFREIQLKQQAKHKGKKFFSSNDLYFYGDEGRSLKITGLADSVSVARYTNTQMLITSTDLDFFKYYREDMGSIMSNLRTKIFLRGLNPADAKYVSEALGKVRKPKHRFYRSVIIPWSSREMAEWELVPVMTPDEVTHIPEGKAIIFTRYMRPFIANVESRHKTKWIKKLIIPTPVDMKKYYAKWGISTAPLVPPELPRMDLKFYDIKKAKKGKNYTGEDESGDDKGGGDASAKKRFERNIGGSKTDDEIVDKDNVLDDESMYTM